VSHFTLVPFPGLSAPEGVQVTGQAQREGGILHLSWRLTFPAGSVAVPAAAPSPERRRELWEETCFEFFLTSPDRPDYWEFNLAPSGHWNVFHFDGYRTGMKDETALDALPFEVSTEAGTCEAKARIDLTPLGLSEAPWRLAISTVVAEADGHVTYWALSHPAPQPDFHCNISWPQRDQVGELVL
jgi:hypothetical protein